MATITFNLNRPKQNGKLKNTPVSIQVELYIEKNKRPQLATGESILPAHWNFEKQRAKSSLTGHTELNLHLTKIENDLTQLWRDNKSVDKETLTRLMRETLRGKSDYQKKTVVDALNALISQYHKERDIKTARKYEALLNHLIEYSKTNLLTFESMDYNFYDSFKTFLYSQPNQLYPKMYLHDQGDHWAMSRVKSPYPVGLMDDTVYKHIINLKIFLKWASKRGYSIRDGYDDWPIISREYTPISLTMAELEQLENCHISAKVVSEKLNLQFGGPSKPQIIAEALMTARDYLTLECRTAQRISDLQAFDINEVHDFKWTFKQNKGQRLKSKVVTVPFSGYCAHAYLILQKNNFKMPAISNQKLNDNIKNVCKIAGITQSIYIERWAGNKKIRISGPKYEFISTHTGRKTFITLALQLGMPESIVMALSGITSYRTLNKYKGPAEQHVVDDWLAKMENNMVLMRKNAS